MNALLVDDEDYVLDYLEEQIPWSSLGIDRVYRSASAHEAISMTETVPVSIVITDIRMPETSGIELLETLYRRSPNTKVILLTGYSEFEYALKALQHGAADYLLKPVTADEVVVSLKKAIAELETETRLKESLSAASDMMKLGSGRMREHLLLDLLLGKKYGSEELERHFKLLQLPYDPSDRGMLALIRIETGADEGRREDFELFSYGVLNMAEEILYKKLDDLPSIWSCKDFHPFVAMLIPLDRMSEQEIKLRMADLRQAVQTYMKRTISIIITKPFPISGELHRQYQQALAAFWRSIGTRSGVVISMDDILDEEELKPLTQLHQTPSLQQLMETGRWEDVANKLDLMIDELNTPPFRTQQHLMEAVYYLYSSFSYIAHKQGDSFADMVGSPSLRHGSYYFQSTDTLKDWALSLVEQFKRSLQDVQPGRSRMIRQIHDFIERCLHEDVSLTRVSEHVYLHPVYLSRLYKKETGESLSAYITRVRMEKAAHLLTTTNKKVADIAVEVGYHKTQYFIHIFKEYYQLTPQNYRNHQA